jgi:hypothetical protein
MDSHQHILSVTLGGIIIFLSTVSPFGTTHYVEAALKVIQAAKTTSPLV